MVVLCPHCQYSNDFDTPVVNEEVVCPSCGSSFRFENGTTADWRPLKGRYLGRFELLETIGSGAFGTVYKARDPELDRTVAIKVPRAGSHAANQELDRFMREARSVAQLKHPYIVAIHEVCHVNGVPYLVCELVEGVTLADIFSARQLLPEEVAGILSCVGDALQNAHANGVIHRDIKPSNIMIRSDNTPCVMDFGLAKRDGGDATMTTDGQVLGTPAYMSPEQAKGESHVVDGRSDVYSLGVVLYQALTGELPFRGTPRMLIHQVLHDDPRPLHRLNDRIHRDLETICLKAMSKEPSRRYLSAGAMADDLRRFLNGEPIHARPVRGYEIAFRWCRQNPARTALILVSSAAILSVTVGSLYYNARLREALRREHEQQQRAETNFHKARDAVDRLLTRVAENKDLENIPSWQQNRQKLLEDALEFYQGFIRESNDEVVRRETGLAYERMGNISLLLGNREQAAESLKKAVTIQNKLLDDFPKQDNDSRNLAHSYHQLGLYLESSEQLSESVSNYRNALQIRERLAKRNPANIEYQLDLAETYNRLGFQIWISGRKMEAFEILDKSLKLMESMVREHTNEIRFKVKLASINGTKALLLREEDRLDEAVLLYSSVLEMLEEAFTQDPHADDVRSWICWQAMARAETLARLKRENEARKDWERMIVLTDGQVNVDLRINRAMALGNLGRYIAATEDVQAMIDSGKKPEHAEYNFAAVFALCSVAASKDEQLTIEKRQQLVENYTVSAISWLKEARKCGFFSAFTLEYLRKDRDFNSIRYREEFRELIRELETEYGSRN